MLPVVDADGLAVRREEILGELASLGELRPGSLFERYRRCGKPGCHCAAEGDPGHGPNWVLTAKVGGRARTRAVPAEAVERTRAQIAEYQRLRALTAELVEVSDGLCQSRLAAEPERGEAAKKGASRRASGRRPRPSG